MKKLTSIIMAAVLTAALSIPALAAPAPVDVQRNNINGQERIEKTYILTPGEDPNSVIEEPFENDGFMFNLETIRFEENKNLVEKDARQTVTVETQTDDAAEILRLLSSSIPYTDEVGISGTLYIDTASIVTAVKDYETKYYAVTDTREYSSMLMNDPSGIPQSTTKNGVTLKLKDISWVVTETALAGDSLVPVQYKAIVSYSGSYSKQEPTGYVTTANYTGQIRLETVESLTVQVTYVGKAIAVPEPEPEPEPLPEAKKSGKALLAVAVIAVLALGGAAAYLFLLRKPQAKVYTISDDGNVFVANISFDLRHPVIDLNPVHDKLNNAAAKVVLDAKTTAKLSGKPVAVLIESRVVHNKVNTTEFDNGEYWIYINVHTTGDENDD